MKSSQYIKSNFPAGKKNQPDKIELYRSDSHLFLVGALVRGHAARGVTRAVTGRRILEQRVLRTAGSALLGLAVELSQAKLSRRRKQQNHCQPNPTMVARWLKQSF